MVPRKKGKRIININHENSNSEEVVDDTKVEDEEIHQVPSAFERALDVAEEAEKDVLKLEIEQLREKAGLLEEELNRERAKLQNIRRRADEDMQDAKKYGAYDFAFDLLNILDCLEMGINCNIDAPPEALKPYIEGVEYTIQELNKVLNKNGIEEIATDIPYDPDLHQVFECVDDSEYDPGTILDVKRKGYQFHDRVLRTALVVIAGSPTESPEGNEE